MKINCHRNENLALPTIKKFSITQIKRLATFLAFACWAVGAVACPEAGEVERSHATGRTLLWASAAWAVLWCGWMLWRRRQQKAVGWGWILALLVPLVNAVPYGLLCLAEVATDINDSLLSDVGLLGCVFAAFVDLFVFVGVISYLFAPAANS